jgi:hypothetical protein
MSAIEEPIIYFLLSCRLSGYFFNPLKPEGFEFHTSGDEDLKIVIKPSEPKNHFPRDGLECRVYGNVRVKPELFHFATNLMGGKFESFAGTKLTLPHVVRGEVLINDRGMVTDGMRVPRYHYPPELSRICNEAAALYQATIERFVKLIRWQQETDGPHGIFEYAPSLYWGTSGNSYVAVGDEKTSWVTGKPVAGILWTDKHQKQISELWHDKNVVEPLAHELLREAKSTAEASPRSALLTACSAIETGVKIHISQVAPAATWLLMEMPSPPVFKILRDYIPLLHQHDGHEIPNWQNLKYLFNIVRDYVEFRNKLTHVGAVPHEALQNLPEFLNSVSDLLYIFNVLEGHDWAKANIRHRARETLNWKSEGHGRMTARTRIMSGWREDFEGD